MGNMLPLGVHAERAGINRDKVRYWASLLGIVLVKVDGRLAAPEEATGLLEAMRKAVAAGASPAVAAQEVKGLFALPMVPTTDQAPRQDDQRLAGIEKVLTLLVEENRRLASQVGKLVEDNQALRQALLPPPADPPRKVIPWQPACRPDPAAGMSWIHRAWLELTAPARLRRWDS